jgi:AraC family transcriptional regulator
MEDKSFVLRGSAAKYFWKGEGIFSIKTFQHGFAHYNTGKGSFRVDPNTFLLLNAGTHYSIEIDQPSNVDSFCLFVDQQTMCDTFQTFPAKGDYLLDNDGEKCPVPHFFERTYPAPVLNTILNTIRKESSGFEHDPMWLKEKLFMLLSVIGGLQQTNLAEKARLPHVKKSTRDELYLRVLKAKEYIHSNYENTIELKDVSLASHLSVNHLLRCFKAVFGLTPHEYRTQLRIQRARQLLETSNIPIAEISTLLGFESSSTFSLLFKRHISVAPETYRKSSK